MHVLIFFRSLPYCSDLQGMKTTAVRDGDDWILNGSKTFISNGINSDIAVVAALTDPAAKSNAHGMGLFIVDCNAEGFKRGRNLKKMGLKGLVSLFLKYFTTVFFFAIVSIL